jgi:TPP-dependent pyruvate/acetoin dehydrogenase alpha subunit
MNNYDSNIAMRIIQSRYSQLYINELLKKKYFKIPVHLALGHEALSESLSASMSIQDTLICTHRNIHYQFARGATLRQLIDEFNMEKTGLSNGLGGSMNLVNPKGSIVYTSNILGNNLCVALGVALSKVKQKKDGVVFVVTGDGAIEEGAFYEVLLNARSLDLPLIVVVENNNWSLASEVKQRRKAINLESLASSIGAQYSLLEENDFSKYCKKIKSIRDRAIINKAPEVLEVKLETLGGWYVSDESSSGSRYINYHAGAAPEAMIQRDLILKLDAADPVYVIKNMLGNSLFDSMMSSFQTSIEGDEIS